MSSVVGSESEKSQYARYPVVIVHKDYPLSPVSPNGGAETATLALARALRQEGRQVFLAAWLNDEFLHNDKAALVPYTDGVYYLNLGSSYDTNGLFQELRKQYRLEHYHLIVASRAQALLESRREPRILSRIFINHEPAPNGLGLQPCIISEVADKIICISNAQKLRLVEAGADPKKVAVIPNGVDLQLFQPGDALTRDYDQLIFAGALVVDKGSHLLIEAFASLKQCFPQLRLDIYGSAQLWSREDYFAIDQAREIPGINFHGAVSQAELAVAFRKGGLLVAPSIFYDAFNMVVAEAVSSGLPALVSENCGIIDYLDQQRSVRIIRQLSSMTLATQIKEMMQDPALLQEMSNYCLTQERGKFGWEKTAKEILEQTEAVVEKKSLLKVTSKDAGNEEVFMTKKEKKVGVLTTYNQHCGIASYAKNLLAPFPSGEIVVLAENVAPEQITSADEANVHRCWNRQSDDYSKLDRVLEQEQVNILHLNCHYRFFNMESFSRFLNSWRTRGVRVISHIHNPYTRDAALEGLISCSDEVIVHTLENRIEVISNGASPERVSVLEMGITKSPVCRDEARRILNIPLSAETLVCFGFVQQHKGIEQAIQSVAELSQAHPQLRLYVVGGAHKEDPTSAEYLQALKNLSQSLNLHDRVSFVEGFVPEETALQYLAAADIIIMNYLSQYYEGSAAVSYALGAGAAVLTSCAPPFARLGEAVFHCTSGYPMPLALHLILTNKKLREYLCQQAASWAERFSWANCAQALDRIYDKVLAKETALVQLPAKENPLPQKASGEKTLRILMWNRQNAISQPGGDTVVMKRIAEELQAQGVEVVIDLEVQEDPAAFSLVHLFNFATPELTEHYARRVTDAGRPYVVTTMYEDRPSFFHQMYLMYEAAKAYVTGGQQKERWKELVQIIKSCQPAPRWENAWTAAHAASLIATGERERAALRRDYPHAPRIDLYPIGCDITAREVSAEPFIKEYGVQDFVLCVGRLETRKNQLALLKAMEDSDLPLVFATGGFTYQPEYEEICRSFQRVGKTLFVGKLSPEMLASAYAASRIHALPSWYELPGIVSMEGAWYGKNIVVSDKGTPRDYFGDDAFYCAPDDTDSIYYAVMAAYYSPMRLKLQERMRELSWQKAAECVREIYESILSGRTVMRNVGAARPIIESIPPKPEVEAVIANASEQAARTSSAVKQLSRFAPVVGEEKEAVEKKALKLCEEGDKLAKSGQLDAALEKYCEACRVAPQLARPERSCGVVGYSKSDYAMGEKHFLRAIDLQPDDAKALAGLGACCWKTGRKGEAYDCYRRALRHAPHDIAIVVHFLQLAYDLRRYAELEEVLERYLEKDPLNQRMRFCLAGCLFKQDKWDKSLRLVEEIATVEPGYQDALELKKVLQEKLQEGVEKKAKPEEINWIAEDTEEGPYAEKLRQIDDLKERREYDKALEECNNILRCADAREEEKAQALVVRGELAACQGDVAAAKKDFEDALSKSSVRYRALTGCGALQAAEGKWSEAERSFGEALGLKRNHDPAIAGLGMCALERKELTQAWSYFTDALLVNPENMRALLGIIDLGYQMKRLVEVERALEKYLALHPANLSLLYSYAGCLYAQGKKVEAIAELQKIKLFDADYRLANELMQKIEDESREVEAQTASC